MENELDKILSNSGIIDNFVFIASKSYNKPLQEYKGIAIYYNTNLPNNYIIYASKDYYNTLIKIE
jgi:hypothetical protein